MTLNEFIDREEARLDLFKDAMSIYLARRRIVDLPLTKWDELLRAYWSDEAIHAAITAEMEKKATGYSQEATDAQD